MPYYLKHHFDPGFDYTKLTPKEREDGSVDHYNMGYVQNVEQGQVLAQWVEDPQSGGDGYVLALDEREMPAGQNTEVDGQFPDTLVATRAGYVFYLDGKITVKATLNVRRDVDFHTGNIHFLGNVIVHGCVRSGFTVQARNVMVKDTVEGASIRATESVLIEAGLKGADKGGIRAGVNVRLNFVEKGRVLAGSRMLVDVACMHSEIYAGRQLAVKGRLVGGQVVSTNQVFVGEQLGGGMGAETVIILGYDAMLLYKSRVVESRIAEDVARLAEAQAMLVKHPKMKDEFQERVVKLEVRLAQYRERHKMLWDGIRAVENLEKCRVMVPGKVHPGVEISIGEASLMVDDYMEDVCFTYQDREVVVSSPALKK